MALVLALDDIASNKIRHRTPPEVPGINTPFFKASLDMPDAPTAMLSQYDPGGFSSAHFHTVDQFQVIVQGKGKFGRHDVCAYCVHFSRAYTPYGPLLADKETGWAFMVFRTRYDPGAQRLPAALDKLKQIPDRQPWQVTTKIVFPPKGPGVSLQHIPEIKDDQGLFACSVAMAPHTTAAVPEPSRGDGQYILVVRGSLQYEKKEHKALTVVFIKPEEDAICLQAGSEGLEALVLNFPQIKQRTTRAQLASNADGFKKWKCTLCAYTYDEANGIAEEGIPAGTRWEDVSDAWNCPDCSANKSDFHIVRG